MGLELGLQEIQDELTKQMVVLGLRFNIDSESERREVLEETSEYISENYERLLYADMVAEYLKETMENYPKHIEPIREYIERI